MVDVQQPMCRWQACGRKEEIHEVSLSWEGANMSVELCHTHRLLAADRYSRGEQMYLVFSRFGVWVENKERI